MKRTGMLAGVCCVFLLAGMLAGCAGGKGKAAQEAGTLMDQSGEVQAAEPEAGVKKKLSIVCSNFPGYDFVRAVAGEQAEISMLLKPGAEAHSYEPSPEEIIRIQNSDLFVYVGGDSDQWVDSILESMNTEKMTLFRMMDAVETMEEVIVEGMEHEHGEEEHAHGDDAEAHGEEEHAHEDDAEAHEEEEHAHEEEAEMDEHVWTSPVNAITLVKALEETISSMDGEHAAQYRANAEAYMEKLAELDQQFRELIENSKRREIIVADRFPFGYFCKEYGLSYYAAFPGCSEDTQASAKTVAFLLDKVKEDEIPVIFHIELSDESMCDVIAADSGAKKELLNAVHNISAQDFKAGKGYIDLMQHNVRVLKEALN